MPACSPFHYALLPSQECTLYVQLLHILHAVLLIGATSSARRARLLYGTVWLSLYIPLYVVVDRLVLVVEYRNIHWFCMQMK
ncbi:hypothetical protein BD626DRAFT_503828 [Schizophyllum amplum]|uniref:Uncharacterized protein n=1 Tax=Schizophyllum amplum TaxID=97359 RepID=A0A550C7L7_9AGAR|nr:hypothetical protein BD626DRAFT_503828 [Auriculariopsis ampla]